MPAARTGKYRRAVSIPFSSGQRMRPHASRPSSPAACWFQSPFHRVKGCDGSRGLSSSRRLTVSIPFSSGQRMRPGRLLKRKSGSGTVSIPFSSGQRMRLRKKGGENLSPWTVFQSPFHRVKGCDPARGSPSRKAMYSVSIPFSSGQRMRPAGSSPRSISTESFNPLFIGSKDATGRKRLEGVGCGPCFNPLFIGSKDATTSPTRSITAYMAAFQSPFHRVKGCDNEKS